MDPEQLESNRVQHSPTIRQRQAGPLWDPKKRESNRVQRSVRGKQERSGALISCGSSATRWYDGQRERAPEEYRVRLKRVVAEVNHDYNVDNLCRELPTRVEQLRLADGGRLPK